MKATRDPKARSSPESKPNLKLQRFTYKCLPFAHRIQSMSIPSLAFIPKVTRYNLNPVFHSPTRIMHLSLQIFSLTLLFGSVALSSPIRWPVDPVRTLDSSPVQRRSNGALMKTRSPANTSVHPDAVTGTTCDDPNVSLVTHDTNVALLGICGGDPATTVGASRASRFTLTAVNAGNGATINVSKGRWEGCVRAAKATCPTGTFTSTCVGGTSDGAGFEFVLSAKN